MASSDFLLIPAVYLRLAILSLPNISSLPSWYPPIYSLALCRISPILILGLLLACMLARSILRGLEGWFFHLTLATLIVVNEILTFHPSKSLR
jgi:hypothetical protein